MQSKLIINYLINLKQQTPFTSTFSLVNLSILLVAVIFFGPACDNTEQTLQEIVAMGETVEQLPLGEGLAIGATAPEFSLPDADGSIHSLSNYNRQKLVVVFYRMGT
ncbi:redoxin domain-containing protein [Candidatus Poribacteria bacterium]|nr:redoxin domain-containing protein [Candidatus Poribacteria bacterium]